MTLADTLDTLDDLHARVTRMLAEIPPRRYRADDPPGFDGLGYVTPPAPPVNPEDV